MDKIIIDSYFDYLAFIWVIMFLIWCILASIDWDLEIRIKLKILLIMTIVVFVAVTGAWLIDKVVLIS